MITRSMCPKGDKERLKVEARGKRIRHAREQSVYQQECVLAKKRAERSLSSCSTGVEHPHQTTTKKRKRSGGSSHPGGQETKEGSTTTEKDAQRKKNKIAHSAPILQWVPPVSPYGLLEEELYKDPWKLLVSCILLNKTTAVQVRRVVFDLFKLYPNPERLCQARVEDLERMLMPLGLYRKRAQSLIQFSHEYLAKEWKDDPTLLHGIGAYAKDAYDIFCRGLWREVTPDDKDLRLYVEFLHRTEGLGVGFERYDDPMDASS